LADAFALLKSGGVFMLTTGDFASLAAKISGVRWHLLTPPDHLFYFTPRGLGELMRRVGFTDLKISYPHGHYSLDYLIERLAKNLPGGAWYRTSPRLRAPLAKVMVPLNLWDIMMITARKP
jgi:hypothetical protein